MPLKQGVYGSRMFTFTVHVVFRLNCKYCKGAYALSRAILVPTQVVWNRMPISTSWVGDYKPSYIVAFCAFFVCLIVILISYGTTAYDNASTEFRGAQDY